VDAWLLTIGSAFASFTSLVTGVNTDGSFLAEVASMPPEQADQELAEYFSMDNKQQRKAVLRSINKIASAVGAKAAPVESQAAGSGTAPEVPKTLWDEARTAVASDTPAVADAGRFPGSTACAVALQGFSDLISAQSACPAWLDDFRAWLAKLRTDMQAATADCVRRTFVEALIGQLEDVERDLRTVLSRPPAEVQAALAPGGDQQKKIALHRELCDKIKQEALPGILVEIQAASGLSSQVADVKVDALSGQVDALSEQQAASSKKAMTAVANVDIRVQESVQQNKQVKVAVKQVDAKADVIVSGQVQLQAGQREILQALNVANTKIPNRFSNLPRICAHFTPRERIMAAVATHYDKAAESGVSVPVVALTGIAGSGKSEVAKQFALRDFERPDAIAPKEGEESKRICWFLNSESSESLLRSYRKLCASFRIEWKAEPDETEAQTLERISLDLQDRLRSYDTLLLFDNARSFESIEPFLPRQAGLRVRVLVTSLNDALLVHSPARGHFAVSLNKGLAEDEALSLLQITSGISTSEAKAGQLELVKELEFLPLAISTAGLYIAAERLPKRGRGVVSPSAASYDATAYLKELRARSVDLLNSDASLGGQSDYKVGQSKALQMAIERTPPHFRTLLDYCTLLDSQALLYDLLVELFTSIVKADPTADHNLVATKKAAESAFDELLASPAMCSLLCVDADTNRLFMHRSTQLQLVVLAEARYSAGGAIRAGSRPLEGAALQAAPNALQQWKSGLIRGVLGAISRVWPAREEDGSSIMSLDTVIPTILRLVDECRTVPMLHASNAELLQELFQHTQLCHTSNWQREQTADAQRLAVAMQKITEGAVPESEVYQWQTMWDSIALIELDERAKALKQMQSLHDTLLQDFASPPNARLALLSRVQIQLADMQRVSNPSQAIKMADAALATLAQWQGKDTPTVQLAYAYRVLTVVNMSRDARAAALESARKGLEVAVASCGVRSVHAAKSHAQLADLAQSLSATIENRRIALDIYDNTPGLGPTCQFAITASLKLGDKLFHQGGSAWLDFFKERRDILVAQLGDHERTAGFIADAADVIWPHDHHAEALLWDEAALQMLIRLHGPLDARTFEQQAQVAVRLHARGVEEDKKLEQLDKMISDSGSSGNGGSSGAAAKNSATEKGKMQERAKKMREEILSNLPQITGRLPVILGKLGELTEHFRLSEDNQAALKVGIFRLEQAKEKLGENDPLTANQFYSVGILHSNLSKYKDSLPYLRRCLELRVAHGDLSKAVTAAHQLARFSEMVSDKEGEAKYRLQALDLAIQAAGNVYKNAAEQHANVAAMYAKRKQFVLALKHLLQALRVRQMLEAEVATAFNSATAVYMKLRNATAPSERTAVLQQGIDAVIDASLSWDPTAKGMARVNVALLALRSSDTVAEARELVQPLLDDAMRLLSEGNHPLSPAHELAAMLASRCGDNTTALMARKSVLEAKEQEKASDLSAAQQDLALAHCWQQQYSQAEELLGLSSVRIQDKCGLTSAEGKRADSLLQWCRRQRTQSPTNMSHLSCLLAFKSPNVVSVQERLKGISACVVFGGAAGENDANPYNLRPLAATLPSLLYYEVTLGGGSVGNAPPGFTIGFSSAQHLLCAMPGSVSSSIGLRCTRDAPSSLLHEDGSVSGPLCPAVKVGDTIGAGMDTANGVVFFTINGKRFKDVAADVLSMPLPCIGFNDDEEAVASATVNFGASPFKFSVPANAPQPSAYSRHHPTCSWLVTFESPYELRRTMSYSGGNTAGTVRLEDAAYALDLLPHSNVLYYELEILDEGRNAAMSFGFGGAKTELGFMCGWTWESVGYHGANGTLGCHPQPEHNASYGPRYRRGDVVGAGLDKEAGMAFFTHNGRRFRNVRLNDVSVFNCPAVSFDSGSTTERVRLNFGGARGQAFKYNHATYSEPIAALPDDFPYKYVHPKCSWLMTFDRPLELKRLMPHRGPPGNTNSAGTVILVDGDEYKLRPLPGSNVLYYELTFLNDGGTAWCSFGFGGAKTEVGFMCGWTHQSVGYHSQQGTLGCHPHAGHNSTMGPRWRTGDVVGAALDRERGVVWFTLNGKRIKDDFGQAKEISFPDCSAFTAAAVSFDTGSTTEKVRLNFGNEPFRYGAPVSRPFDEDDPRCSNLIDWPTKMEMQRRSDMVRRGAATAVLDHDSFRLRALPAAPALLYYEITLLNAGEQSMGCIGFGPRRTRRDRAPGWDAGSIGYHGDDGKLFCAGLLGNGTSYAETWQAGDVIGAALDRAGKRVFFTRNGVKLRDVDVTTIVGTLDVAIVAFGTGATTERIKLNFGDEPFAFHRA